MVEDYNVSSKINVGKSVATYNSKGELICFIQNEIEEELISQHINSSFVCILTLFLLNYVYFEI